MLQATALRELRRQQHGRPTNLGQLLRQIEEQTLKSCDTDKGARRSNHAACSVRGLPVARSLSLGMEGQWHTVSYCWQVIAASRGSIL